MRIAIMQPYFFPYIGYFQLINAVDKFIIYDDVSFIKQGWINRNFLLINEKPMLFSIPLEQISSNKLIRDTNLNGRLYPLWKEKFLKTLETGYKKAPFFRDVFAEIDQLLTMKNVSLTCLLYKSIVSISGYLNLATEIVPSSTVYQNQELKGQDRVLDICKKEKSTCYYNLIGGKDLYEKSAFSDNSIELVFIKPNNNVQYIQGAKKEFVPNLSMIDVLMHNSKEEIRRLLNQYELS